MPGTRSGHGPRPLSTGSRRPAAAQPLQAEAEQTSLAPG